MVLSLALLGFLVIAATIAVLVSRGGGFGWSARGTRAPLPNRPGQPLARVDIGAGEIEVMELLSFLADFTGLPLIVDMTDERITGTRINLAAPMNNVDPDVVRAFIEENGFLVEVDDTQTGKPMLRVEVAPGHQRWQERRRLQVQGGARSR